MRKSVASARESRVYWDTPEAREELCLHREAQDRDRKAREEFTKSMSAYRQKLIDALAARGEWISIDDALPNDHPAVRGEPLLVKTARGIKMAQYRAHMNGGGVYGEDGISILDATHWMMLPEIVPFA